MFFPYCGVVEDVENSNHFCHDGAKAQRETERSQPGRQLQMKATLLKLYITLLHTSPLYK